MLLHALQSLAAGPERQLSKQSCSLCCTRALLTLTAAQLPELHTLPVAPHLLQLFHPADHNVFTRKHLRITQTQCGM